MYACSLGSWDNHWGLEGVQTYLRETFFIQAKFNSQGRATDTSTCMMEAVTVWEKWPPKVCTAQQGRKNEVECRRLALPMYVPCMLHGCARCLVTMRRSGGGGVQVVLASYWLGNDSLWGPLPLSLWPSSCPAHISAGVVDTRFSFGSSPLYKMSSFVCNLLISHILTHIDDWGRPHTV